MKLVSFTTATTTHERYGILTAEGVIELGPHLGEHCPTLADALAYASLERLAPYASCP